MLDRGKPNRCASNLVTRVSLCPLLTSISATNLLRPGRLLGTCELCRLSRAQALRLAHTKGLTLPEEPDFSLAEIYCHPPEADQTKNALPIGFAPMPSNAD